MGRIRPAGHRLTDDALNKDGESVTKVIHVIVMSCRPLDDEPLKNLDMDTMPKVVNME